MANLDDRLLLSHFSAISACQGTRVARSRSTPSLEQQPGVVTHITHTRYIRAGSAEPHRSIYSIFSNLDGPKRANSMSRTDNWSRGSSMSRGSSTESLMTMAEARKKREGSQESITSTRSLKVISGKSITSGVSRRGAKLNRDIQAPWLSGEKVPRVISSPCLSAVGSRGGTRSPPRGTSRAAPPPAHESGRRASIEIPKHIDEIERRLGIEPRFKSAPDINVESLDRSHLDDWEDLGYNEYDVTNTKSKANGEPPLGVEEDHVTAERSSEVHTRAGGVRRRHTDLPERVARSRAKAQEEEAKREREKEVSKEREPRPPPPPPPPPPPVHEQEEKANKINGICTGGESDTAENTGQGEKVEEVEEEKEEEKEEETPTETQQPPLPLETDIDSVEEAPLDLDNPTPSKKRKVERTVGEEEDEEVEVVVVEEGEQGTESQHEGTDVLVNINMAGNPGPTPTPAAADGAGLTGAGVGAPGEVGTGPEPSSLVETEISYPPPEPNIVYPGEQSFHDEEDDGEEFEIEVEVVPESYMETPEYEEEEEPEFDLTRDWEPETPSYDDSDYYSYISESFERRDRILRAMREAEMEMADAGGEPFSLQSSLDEDEATAYDDYVIPYITKNEPPSSRRSLDLSDYGDELDQVFQPRVADAPTPSSVVLSDSIRQPPASRSEPQVPINKATRGPQEDTAHSPEKPHEKPLLPGEEERTGDALRLPSLSTTQGADIRQELPLGSEDQRVPNIEGSFDKEGETTTAAPQYTGAAHEDYESGEQSATLEGEPLITPTEAPPRVASKPQDKPTVKRQLRSILKRSGSNESYHSRDGDGPREEPEQQLKRYSYTEDLSIVQETPKTVEQPQEVKIPGEKEPEPEATPQEEEEITNKPYYETDIDTSVNNKTETPPEEQTVEKEVKDVKKEEMAETTTTMPHKRGGRTVFPSYSEFATVDIRDSNTLDYKMRITILDIIMNFLLLTPLVVLHYHAVSKVLELVFLQYFPKIGSILLLGIGIALEFCCIFFQKSIASSVPRPSLSPEAENIHFILASKTFNFVLALGNISHMLAASEIIDLYIGDSFGASFKTAVTSVVVLMALRCGRNVIAPPLYVSIDHDDLEVFSTATLFQTEHDGNAESAVDTLGTTAVIFTFVHFHWAGVWNCLDNVFFPGTFWLSMFTSVAVGYALCLAFLFLQEPALKISRNLQREDKEPLRIAFENVFNVAANIGVVLLWKGLWMVYDVMAEYFPIYCRSWDITPLATTVLSFVLLSLAHCSSSLLFQDCEIDGELKDGEGVLFCTGYLSEILGDVKETSTTSSGQEDKKQDKITTKQMAEASPQVPSVSVSKSKQPTKTKSRDVKGPSDSSETQSKQKIA